MHAVGLKKPNFLTGQLGSKLSLSQALKTEKTLTTVFRGILNEVLMQIQI